MANLKNRAEMTEPWVVDPEFKVRFAGKIFVNTPHLLVFEGEAVFSMKRRDEDGVLEIDLAIFNSNGNRVGEVQSGVMSAKEKSTFDRISSANQFSIREAATGRTVCDIRRRGSACERSRFRRFDSDVFA